MLMSLMSLSDDEIETVTSAVSRWCKANHCEIDSTDGRRAITVAVDLAQSKLSADSILNQLTLHLEPVRDLGESMGRRGQASQ